MKALHFGAGNIGRGFIGKLLADAGIELTFADVNQTVLDALNARHSYQVHVVGENRAGGHRLRRQCRQQHRR